MSRVHRLLTTDRIFFVTVNLRGALNDKKRIAGPVWQHQFWDRFVRHQKELAARFDYVHLNPVRKGLVSRPDEWRWSSYNNFALEKEQVKHCPIQVDYVRLPEGYHG